MMFLLYRGLFVPFMLLSLPFLALFNKKIRKGLGLRIYGPKLSLLKAISEQSPILIHAASGEFEYAKPLIRQLKAKNPGVPIVVTFFSPTYAAQIKNFPGVDASLPLPLDLPGPTFSLLKCLKPRVILLARTDLWPEFLYQAGKLKIPRILFSATQKPVTNYLAKVLLRFRFSYVDQIFCVSEEDKVEIEKILKAAKPVEVIGDSRYDQVAYRLNHPKALPTHLKPDSTKLNFMAGSTWPEDEDVLLKAVLQYKSRMRMILIPHEVDLDHIEQIQGKAHKLGLKVGLFSRNLSLQTSSQPFWQDHDVLLVDQLGILAELYTWADAAFVGGSFKRSVHSVMEPLGVGCLTLVGPFHLNNREALQFQKVMTPLGSAVQVAHNLKELEQLVGHLIVAKDQDPKSLQSAKQDVLGQFNARLGATKRLIEDCRLT